MAVWALCHGLYALHEESIHSGKKKYKELRMNEPQAFAKLCKYEGQFLLEVHEAMKGKNVAETSVAGQPNQKAPVGQVRQEVSMTRAVRGEGPVQVHPQLPVRLRLAPAVASRDSTGTSSLLPWVRLLDPQKAPSQPGLHPDRCKARVGRDGVCCGGDGCGGCLGLTALGYLLRGLEWGCIGTSSGEGMHRYEISWRRDRHPDR